MGYGLVADGSARKSERCPACAWPYAVRGWSRRTPVGDWLASVLVQLELLAVSSGDIIKIAHRKPWRTTYMYSSILFEV
jgi:hypothetical protein